jgi:hypothetical protein
MQFRPKELLAGLAAMGAGNTALKTRSMADAVENGILPEIQQMSGNWATTMARYLGDDADAQQAFNEKLNRFHEGAAKVLPYAVPALAGGMTGDPLTGAAALGAMYMAPRVGLAAPANPLLRQGGGSLGTYLGAELNQ